ncbi:MAG TPA: DNA methyltransferase, partial [Thermosynechococcaceae cyanobacterium]
MDGADRQRVQKFLKTWKGSQGNERANYQGFFLDLCDALGVDRPPPKGNIPGDPYAFDKDIRVIHKDGFSTNYADFYKDGHFLIEAKQGGSASNKGTAKRGTKTYDTAMEKAFYQALSYTPFLANKPPFVMTCDIGSHFEVWMSFSGNYGGYGARETISLDKLLNEKEFDRFVAIFSDPQSLNPEKYRAKVTREVADTLAKLARWLEEQGHEPQEASSFLMRCIFTMFAEDVDLLKGEVFTKALKERWIADPASFRPQVEALWQTMNTGGSFGFERILRFNGSFFANATAFDLPQAQLEILHEAADKDWSAVEPAIFGTLLERALDKKERSRLGAHYTPRSYVERLVRPVVMEPLREEWLLVESEVDRLLILKDNQQEPTKAQRQKAAIEIQAFLDKLQQIRVLDPACGTGNFLYVTLDLLKTLEQEVQTRLLDVVGQVTTDLLEEFDPRLAGRKQVNPAQFLGIEINPRAAAIAELVIWIGYLQWHFKRYGTTPPPEPILQDFHNIEYRDAVLAYDGKEEAIDQKTGRVKTRWGGRMMKHPVTSENVPDPSDQIPIYRYINARPAEWQEADYIVSNPPFIGNARMRQRLGDGYVEALREVYVAVPDSVDYVMYWWHKSAELVRLGNLKSFGLITT